MPDGCFLTGDFDKYRATSSIHMTAAILYRTGAREPRPTRPSAPLAVI
jgi:hypothetical protein